MIDPVLCERRDTIALLTINAPKTRNALAGEVLLSLLEQLDSLASDDSCRAIVLSGGSKSFSSGGDLNNMKAERTLAVARERVALGGKLARALMLNPKPVIAAVEGYAAGAGFSLAVAADYVVASEASKFIAAFSRVGLMPDVAMLWTLTQRVSLGQAKRMIASARKVEAQEALQLGIADELVAEGATLDKAIEVANEFTIGAPLPFAMMKQAYARGINSMEDALQCELQAQSSLYLTKDHREAVAAFLEKREPQFKGC